MSLLTEIAARFQWVETLIQLAGSGNPEQILQANPNRFAAGFCSNAGSPIVISTHQDYGSGNGITLATNDFRWFDIPKYGPMSQQAWYVTSAVAGVFLVVFEVVDNGGN